SPPTGFFILFSAIIQRVSGITLTRSHVRVEMEQLPQPHDRREITQSFSLEFRTQLFFRFVLCLTGDRAEKRARRVFERFHCAIGKSVAFRAPKFPADIAGNLLGITFLQVQSVWGW